MADQALEACPDEIVMKKKILIYCNNYLGFTLLNVGGVLSDLITHFDVTILTSPSAQKTIVSATDGQCQVIGHAPTAGPVQTAMYGFISDILGMGYAEAAGRRNLTGPLHRTAHIQRAKGKPFFERYKTYLVVGLSQCAEKFKFFRKLLNRIFFLVAPKHEFMEVLATMSPTLCVATTAGLGRDGVFFAASHQAGIPCLALIQSWDRTASKGYPANHPDYCIVWNEAMRFEASAFLEIPQERVYVEGAPPWDNYLAAPSALPLEEKIAFFQQWKLHPEKKLVFVALNGGSTHPENIRMIRDLAAATARGELAGVQIMFRTHPAYLVEPERTRELEQVFAELKNPDLHLMHPIVADPSNKDYIVTAEDRQFMHDMFRACDATVAIMSTWMIESAIFDKPNICIEYGRYTTQLYDFDLSEYKAEHIARVFAYGAVHRVNDRTKLAATINEVLSKPYARRVQRAQLVEGETGPHKGNARAAFLQRILAITDAL